jgi:crotonobetaine/carnitine-CoA ligase
LSIRGVRGLSLFAEYLHNPEATAASFDDEGYFLTGDLVRIGEDGSYFFSDRSKDMLKVGGENVAASEIERVIMSVPGVLEVAVVAQSDPMLDQVPVACLRLSAGHEPELVERDVLAACAHQLASFKQPRQIRIFDDFPRSTLEKIAKAQLRELIEQEKEVPARV